VGHVAVSPVSMLPRGVVTYHEAFSEFALSVTQVTKETRP